MNKKVELYFIIYIVTIISFFTIEGELRDKKKEQDQTLKEVSSLVLNNFIDLESSKVSKNQDNRIFDFSIKKNIPYFDDVFLTFEDKLTGEQIVSIPVDSYSDESNLTCNLVNNQRQIINKAIKSKSSIDDVVVKLQFDLSMDIFDEMELDWEKQYGGKEVTEKLRALISEIIYSDPDYNYADNRFSLNKDVNIPWKDIEYVPMKVFLKFDNVDVIRGTKWKNTLLINNIQEKIDGQSSVKYLDIFIDGKKYKGKKAIPKTLIEGVANKTQKITVKASWDYGEFIESEASFNIVVRDPEFKNKDQFPDNIYCSPSENVPPIIIYPEVRGIKDSQLSAEVVELGEQRITKTSSIELGPYFESDGQCSGDVDFTIRVDGQKIDQLNHSIEITRPPAPKIETVSWDKNTGVATIKVTCYGYGNEIKNTQLKNGTWIDKSSKGKLVNGGQQIEYVHKIRAGNSNQVTFAEINLRVKDRFNKQNDKKPLKYKKKVK